MELKKQIVEALDKTSKWGGWIEKNQYPVNQEDLVINFVEEAKNFDECWQIVSVGEGDQTTFWKIPGYYYNVDDIVPEIRNLSQVEKDGGKITIVSWVENGKATLDNLYSFVGYVTLHGAKMGQHSVDGFDFEVVDRAEACYDATEGYAIFNFGGRRVKITESYDSTSSSVSWGFESITEVKRIETEVNSWKAV